MPWRWMGESPLDLEERDMVAAGDAVPVDDTDNDAECLVILCRRLPPLLPLLPVAAAVTKG